MLFNVLIFLELRHFVPQDVQIKECGWHKFSPIALWLSSQPIGGYYQPGKFTPPWFRVPSDALESRATTGG
jgi:hypothetical protein